MDVPLSSIEFTIGRLNGDPDGAPTLTPSIEGHDFVQLVTSFESARRFEPVGGYGGLVPSWFNYGDLRLHYLGIADDQWPSARTAWVLGCDCGEVGCWPFCVSITLTQDQVVWTKFGQEHRPHRDYSGLGPFAFDRAQYEAAVATAVRDLPDE